METPTTAHRIVRGADEPVSQGHDGTREMIPILGKFGDAEPKKPGATLGDLLLAVGAGAGATVASYAALGSAEQTTRTLVALAFGLLGTGAMAFVRPIARTKMK